MPALKWPHPLRWGKTVRGRPWRGVGSPWQTMEKTMAAWQMAIAHRNQNESWEADANPSQELPASRAGPKGDPGGLLKPSPMPRPTKAKIKTHTESQRPIDDFSDYSAKTCLENSNMLQNATECNKNKSMQFSPLCAAIIRLQIQVTQRFAKLKISAV